jgi:predicted nucleotidyltransferase
LLDLSTTIDEVTAGLFVLIDQVTNELKIEYLVVGATARDLVMYHGYGAPVQRATKDLDFAIQIASWEQFEIIIRRLW